jgi:hypothetical protein
MIKTKMRWAGHVAQIGQKRKVKGLLVGKPEKGRFYREDKHVGGWIILRWILE